VLRWQARLDQPFADRTLPWLFAAVLFLVLAAPALARARSLEPSETLARFTQAVTMLHDHRSDRITLNPAGVASPQSLASLDGSLVLYPLGYLLGFLPARSSLVVLQSAALAVAVVPLWRLARTVTRLRVGATAALAVAYGLYPPLHALGLDGFDPLALAVPLLFCSSSPPIAGTSAGSPSRRPPCCCAVPASRSRWSWPASSWRSPCGPGPGPRSQPWRLSPL